jgi:vacuolar protein sorting-associated protein VTA1
VITRKGQSRQKAANASQLITDQNLELFVKFSCKMALKIPVELKKITQYIRRAEELSKQSNPSPETLIVAYHCRQYAVQIGIPLATTPDSKKCLGDILTTLEQHRSKMGNFSKSEKYKICRDFALKIFNKADQQDRAGKSDKGNARTFYAAASFLDILKQFQNEEEQGGEDAVEEQKKSFYAKWKATEILKAIKEGREVKPGGYGENITDGDEGQWDGKDEEEQGTEVDMNGTTTMTEVTSPPPPPPYSFQPPPTVPSDNPSDQVFDFLPPPVKPSPLPDVVVEQKPAASGGFMSNIFGSANTKKYTKAQIADAKELTVFAQTALDENDGPLAVERLKQALACLGHNV